jgi:hypothetical protein
MASFRPIYLTVAVLGFLSSAIAAHAQMPTIPEQLKGVGRSMTSGPTVPSGPPPLLEDVLGTTDVIAEGVISGEAVSKLTADQRDIYTEYHLRNTKILLDMTKQSPPRQNGRPELKDITVRMPGGRVTIDGLTFTRAHQALPLPASGEKYIFLLTKKDGYYTIALGYYGIFSVVDGNVSRKVRKEDFASELEGLSIDEVETALVNRLRLTRRIP